MNRDTKIIAIGLGIIAIIGFVFREKIGSTVSNLIESVTEKSRIGAMVPSAQTALRTLRERLLALGMRTMVGSTRRTEEEQAEILEAGNSATKNSWHLLGRAVDLYPYNPDTGKADMNGVRLDLFRQLHAEAAKVGWEGLAFNPDGTKRYITNKQGKKIWDGAHIQFREGMTFAEAQRFSERVV